MNDPYSILLTESTAKALFGNENPINKTVRFDNKDDLKVTGILKDVPSNSSLNLNWMVPFSYLDQTNRNVKQHRTGRLWPKCLPDIYKIKTRHCAGAGRSKNQEYRTY